MRKLKREYNCIIKIACRARKNNVGKVGKIQDDIEKQKRMRKG